MTRAYEEIIDFIAGGSSPSEVVEFHPSDGTRERVAELLRRQKTSVLSSDETAELDHYLQLEHIMRLAKARARQRLRDE